MYKWLIETASVQNTPAANYLTLSEFFRTAGFTVVTYVARTQLRYPETRSSRLRIIVVHRSAGAITWLQLRYPDVVYTALELTLA